MTQYPPLNIELFRYLYPEICVSPTSPSDNILLQLYQKQITILGYFYEIDTLDYRQLGEVMEYALAHFMIWRKRGGMMSAAVTGEIQFTQSVEQKTATKASDDYGWLTSSDFGVDYWKDTQYGRLVLTICLQYMRKIIVSCGQLNSRKTDKAEDYMYTSKTLRIDNVSIQKTIELFVNKNGSPIAENEVLVIDDKVLLADTYTTKEIDGKIELINKKATEAKTAADAANTKADNALTEAGEAKNAATEANKKAEDAILLHNDMKIVITSGNDSVESDVKFDEELNQWDIDLQASGGESSYPPVDGGLDYYTPEGGVKTLTGQAILDVADDALEKSESATSAASEAAAAAVAAKEVADAAKAESDENSQAIDGLNQSIAKEIQDRTNADKTLQDEIDSIKPITYQNKAISTISVSGGINGVIDDSGNLGLSLSEPNGYYAKFELSELAGFDGIDNKAAITWSEYAIANPVCALKIPFGQIGDLMGFDTQFDNKNLDGAGQREYKVTLKFLVITDAGVAGKSTFTIYNGSEANDGAFHMWTAGIDPEIDYSNQNTDHNDIYTFEVDNLRITPITINLKKSVFIENRLRKFYFGISMKGWFQDPHTVNYKLYDYVEMILTPV